LRFGLRALIPGFDPNVLNVRSGFSNLKLRLYAIGSPHLLAGSSLNSLIDVRCVHDYESAFIIVLDLALAELLGRHFSEHVRIG
jgi:hypothetical protein